MWKDIDTFTSNVTARILEFNQTYGRQIAELKDKVKEMLMAPINDPAEKVNLINLLNRLGVSYHFRAEIEEHLNHIFEAQPNIPEDNDYDLYTIALFFRVLKQHGYKLSSSKYLFCINMYNIYIYREREREREREAHTHIIS
ncbi:hypothetical protein JRO89_XS15G0177100 [Xanthoceras sorbifolium]|uniref:Terpene synthase N-terminal domain-containing protein n=1 Tax=Xanthoceras sorbifolium TaxID=99658 RepID=A0ABQ8H2R9_9ROSI|nr:hypothetical protein JRO89_XS15G0177100 [Xanthoceras sorbifolium]